MCFYFGKDFHFGGKKFLLGKNFFGGQRKNFFWGGGKKLFHGGDKLLLAEKHLREYFYFGERNFYWARKFFRGGGFFLGVWKRLR